MNEDTINLNSALLEQLRIREKSNQLSQAAIDLETKFLESMKKETDVKNQIETLDNQILKLKQLELETNDKSLKILIDQYSKVKGVLSLLDKKKDLSDKIKNNFLDTLGATEEMADIFKTGGLLYAGSEAFKNSASVISDAFSTTFGTAFEMYKTMGINAKEGAILAGEIGKARISMAGLLYDGEDFANASKALVDQFGNVNMATDDMVLGVTELSQLTGDAASAVALALSFQNAGVAVDEVDSVLKDIGSKTGVTATKIAKEMADNQYLMVGATKQELKLIGELNAELIKQGATRESIRGSAKSLMDIENTIQQANKIALMTGKMVNTARLTEAAMQARTAEGAENKAKAQNELLKALKEELGVNGNISDQSDVTIEAMTSLSGLTEEQLLNMEQAGIAQKNNNKLIEQSNAFLGAVTAGAQSFGAGIGSATLELVKMIAQAVIFNKVMTGSFGMGNLKFGKFGGGGGGAPLDNPTPTPTPSGDSKGVESMTKTIEKIDAEKLLAGGAALVLVAASVFVFAKAVQEFMSVSWEAVGMAIVSMLALVGALALVGLIASGPQAVFLLAGAAAMLVIAAALFVLGKAIQEVATGFKMMGELTTQLTGLVSIAPGLIALAGIFGLLGLSLIGLSIGLAAVTLFLPTLLILAATLPSIANSLGIGGGSSETTTSNTKQSDPLLEEIKGLRADIKAQPINVVLNNKIVGEINRASRASNSYVNK